ncbi:MAG TPA: alpha/beta hydrolase [Acidimicrobiales bacterium]
MPESFTLAVTEHVPPAVREGSPVVVLVHGSLDRAASFARVVRRLDDVHTVTYDRRGYQRSRRALPLNTTLDGHIDDLLAVIAGRPAVVVGHSYGGDIALGAALRPPGDPVIRGVVAYEPPMPWLGPWSRRPPDPAGSAAASPAGGAADPEDPAAAAERFFRRMVGDAAWERLSETAKDERRADGPALEAELTAIRLPRAPFDVTTLAVPSTFGRGERSASRHRDTVAWLAANTPDGELVEIAGASHGAHLTHPDAFATMVRSAVARAEDALGTPV